jgi:hypothetical protein
MFRRVEFYRRAGAQLALFLVTSALAGQSVPLPPRRPLELTPKAPQNPQLKEALPPAEVKVEPEQNAAACLQRLDKLHVLYQAAPAPGGEGGCGIAIPVRLEAITVSGNRTVKFPATPLIDCTLAEKLSLWLSGVVDPVFSARLGPVKFVASGPGYECRNRNHDAGAKLSAHANGLAIDLTAFELLDGRKISIPPPGDAPELGQSFETVRSAACGWFTTVLGPGADAEHQTHMHVDIGPHGSDQRCRICQ